MQALKIMDAVIASQISKQGLKSSSFSFGIGSLNHFKKTISTVALEFSPTDSVAITDCSAMQTMQQFAWWLKA
jgi:hypothetical protein